jgi:hypothetical protein
MHNPFAQKKTAHSIMAPLLKIVSDLRVIVEEQAAAIEKAHESIAVAKKQLYEATAEQVTAENFISKVNALIE